MKIQYPHQEHSVNELFNGKTISSSLFTSPDLVKQMEYKISKLEMKLSRHQADSAKNDKLVKLMWGDSFEIDALH